MPINGRRWWFGSAMARRLRPARAVRWPRYWRENRRCDPLCHGAESPSGYGFWPCGACPGQTYGCRADRDLRSRDPWRGRPVTAVVSDLLDTLAAPDETELAGLDAWWRAANYLTIGQFYLQGNPLLR